MQRLVDGLGDLIRSRRSRGLWSSTTLAGSATASEVGEQLLDAVQSTDANQRLEARPCAMALHARQSGDLGGCRHMEHGIALYDRNQHAAQALFMVVTNRAPAVTITSPSTGRTLRYPDRSLAALQQALRQAESLKHPMTMITALW